MRLLRWLVVLLLLLAAPAWAQEPLATAQAVAGEGYFDRCASGDMRGCSYFARLVALRLNPMGNPSSWGTLTKPAGGSNVEGYADDAIVLGADPSNRQNVYDLVVGAGAPGATVTANGPLPRRTSDVWEAPKPLTAAQMAYLRPGATPSPTPTPAPTPAPQPTPTNLQPILDKLAQIEALIANLAGAIDNAYVAASGASQLASDAKQSADNASATASDTRRRVEDVLTAVDLARQALGQPLKCIGRAPAFGGTVTMTCQP